MKIKILSLALLGLLSFTSCSNDDNLGIDEISKKEQKQNDVVSSKSSLMAYSPGFKELTVNQNVKLNYGVGSGSINLVMQNDSNLVLQHTTPSNYTYVAWASNTAKDIYWGNPYLKMQEDGNLVIYSQYGSNTGPYQPIWATGTSWGGFISNRDMRLEVIADGGHVYASLHMYKEGVWFHEAFKVMLY